MVCECGENPLWLHNMNVRVPIGGVPEFTDAIVAPMSFPKESARHGSQWFGDDSACGTRHSTNALAASFYVELHGIAEIVGEDSLFLLSYGWANSSGEWEPTATAYARKRATKVVPILSPCPALLPPRLTNLY